MTMLHKLIYLTMNLVSKSNRTSVKHLIFFLLVFNHYLNRSFSVKLAALFHNCHIALTS